jgi:hypothetical protein
MLGKGTALFGVLVGPGLGRVARNCLESFARFAGNEKFSSPLGPTPVDRVTKCGELLRALEAMQRTDFHHIITGDDSWFYLEYQHASYWLTSCNKLSQKEHPAIGTAKFVLTAIWGRQRLPPAGFDAVTVQI